MLLLKEIVFLGSEKCYFLKNIVFLGTEIQ